MRAIRTVIAAALLALLLWTGPAAARGAWIVFFDSGSAALDSRADAVLINLAYYLLEDDVRRIELNAFTDRVGPEAANRRLALARAETVRNDLIRRGIRPEYVKIVVWGERRPLVETPDGVAEPLNRRVEIAVLMICRPSHPQLDARHPDC